MKYFILVLFLTACHTVTKEECTTKNWRAVGAADARAGHPATLVNDYSAACAKVDATVSQDDYIAGFAEGAKQFCTAENGEAFGRRGDTYQHSCPASYESAFLKGYNLGHRQYKLKKREEELEDRERKLKQDEDDARDREAKLKREEEEVESRNHCSFDSDCASQHCSFGQCTAH